MNTEGKHSAKVHLFAVQEERGPRKPKLKQQQHQQQTSLTNCSTPEMGTAPSELPRDYKRPSSTTAYFYLPPVAEAILWPHTRYAGSALGLHESLVFIRKALVPCVSPGLQSIVGHCSFRAPSSSFLPPRPPPHLCLPPLKLHTSAFSTVRPNPHQFANSNQLREEIGVQVLGWLVRQARTSPFLTPLLHNDLLLLLTRAWPQLLLLHAAYWPLDLLLLLQNETKPDMYKSEEADQVSAALRMCRQYSLDSTELMLLSAVILLRSQPGLSTEGMLLISALQERAQATLGSHTASVCPSDPLRPSNLLLLVASLHCLPQQVVTNILIPSLASPQAASFVIATFLSTS
ncbi:hypothetical protein O3P69_013795 [Scylla paramamosain]|uniref:NR LBD domain-containing protein n=1 Tax=Scylla paramamosain TaxID=85552 RepID=A0AAW0ST65_SCYPA